MKDALLIGLALLVLAAGFVLQRSGWLQENTEAEIIDVDCDLQQQSCLVSLPTSGQLQFSIQPKPVSALQPMLLQLRLPANLNFSGAVKVQFEGLNMDMGFNQVILERQDDASLSATALLPACTASQMFWHFHLLLNVDGRLYDFRFPVTT